MLVFFTTGRTHAGPASAAAPHRAYKVSRGKIPVAGEGGGELTWWWISDGPAACTFRNSTQWWWSNDVEFRTRWFGDIPETHREYNGICAGGRRSWGGAFVSNGPSATSVNDPLNLKNAEDDWGRFPARHEPTRTRFCMTASPKRVFRNSTDGAKNATVIDGG